MDLAKLSISKFITSIFIYTLFVVVLHFILGMGPRDVWDDLMKWCRKG